MTGASTTTYAAYLPGVGYALVGLVAFTAGTILWFPGLIISRYVPELMGIGVLTILGITAVSLYYEDRLTDGTKEWMLRGYLVAVFVPTIVATGGFLHAQATSWSGGEVHWHADYEVLVEGNASMFPFDPSAEYAPGEGKFCTRSDGEYLCQVELVDPGEFCKRRPGAAAAYFCTVNDRTGSTRYHEHDDKRIHLEGVFKEREDATLRAFFQTFGGELTNERLVYPIPGGVINVTEDGRSLKIIVEKGAGGNRHWCVIAPEREAGSLQVCTSADNGQRAHSPGAYVISPFTRNPRSGTVLDNIFVIYDDATLQQAYNDLQKDGHYRGIGIVKVGGGGGE